jgi:hypothetical protein
MIAVPSLLLGHSLRSKLSLHAKANMTTTIVCVRMKLYDQKFKELVCLFAADVFGDGKGDVVGPFEVAKTRFFRGQVILAYAGWFGEINKDYKTLITKLAQEALAGDDGMRISHLVNLHRKG